MIHAALDHLPGRYRGGEGDDPDAFLARNLQGTCRLIAAAERAGVGRLVLLSSRAAYGRHPPGTTLREDLPCRPDTLYGRVKREAELALEASRLPGASLRATGVYGPAGRGRAHKWSPLFADFAAGRAVAPRIGSEVHGADLASAVRIALTTPLPPAGHATLNVSDILLDRRDLLAAYAEVAGVRGPLPPAADARGFAAMATDRLRALGWRPRGRAGLVPALREMIAG